METRYYWLLGFAGLFFIFLSGNSNAAAASLETCSSVEDVFGASSRIYAVSIGGDTTSNCNGSHTYVELNAGSSAVFTCNQGTTGIAPPTTVTIITVYWQEDNDNFGSPQTAPIKSQTSVCDGSAAAEVTFFCTSNGNSGGSSRYGLVRVIIRIQNNVPAKDENSDNDGDPRSEYGIIFCKPKILSVTDQANGQTVSTYVGGDSLQTTWDVEHSPYENNLFFKITHICDAGGVNSGNDAVAPEGLFQGVIKGARTLWPTGCTLKQKIESTRASAISGYGAVKQIRFNTAGACSSCTYADAFTVTKDTGKLLSRILTPTNPNANPGCNTGLSGIWTTRYDRGETATMNCNWKDARGGSLSGLAGESQRLCTNYIRRTTEFDATDFPSGNGKIFSSGTDGSPCEASSGVSTTHTAATTATNTNSTVGLDYVPEIQLWSSVSRTEAELLNWGSTSTGILDVNSIYRLTRIFNSAVTPVTTNRSSYVIGSDIHFTKIFGIKGARGQAIASMSVSCERFDPNEASESSKTIGTTDTNGDAGPSSAWQVLAPSGVWRFSCSSTKNGNTLLYDIEISYVSALSSNQKLVVLVRLYLLPNDTYAVNITAQGVEWDPMTGTIQPVPSDDDDVRAYVRYQTGSSQVEWATEIPMSRFDGDEIWYVNLTGFPLETAWTKANVLAKLNMSQKTFIGSAQIVTVTETDPIFTDSGAIVIPDTIMLPAGFMLITALGISLAFMKTSNPLPSGVGMLIQIANFKLATDNYTLVGVGMYLVLVLIIFLALIGLAYKAYLGWAAMREDRNTVKEYSD